MRVSTIIVLVACAALPAAAEETRYKNLKVLPADISRSELSEIMLGNLRGLGLPRLAGKGCLHCHVGDLEAPRSEWDYASDAKPMKAKARVMMAMVKAINDDYLGKLESRVDSSLKVTCTTCHAGRTDPRPLADVLWTPYEIGGLDSANPRHQALRKRYFGGDAYDFRVHVLPVIAMRMADKGAIDDAIALAALNVEVYPDAASAKGSWFALKLERTIGTDGVDAALAQLKAIEPSLPSPGVAAGLLDSLAWRLNRTGREAQGHALIEANHAKFPEEYTAVESLAFIRADTGRAEEAFALLETWLEENPDHARARRLLVNLREKHGG